MATANEPITPAQAQDLLQYIINQFQASGFGSVVTDINNKLKEQLNEDIILEQIERPSYLTARSISPVNQLIFFIDEAIESLGVISNDNFPGLLANFNQYVTSEQGNIETIQVELLAQDEIILYDLANLPTYKALIKILQEIRQDIIIDQQ
jgi:hypothetical protein